MARGDVLLQLGRTDEARDAYADAKSLAAQGGVQLNLATLDQKIQSLNRRPAREIELAQPAPEGPAPGQSASESADTDNAAVTEEEQWDD